MIKLESKTMTRAIERAKAVHPKVRVISASDRVYAVTGRGGNEYTVKFAVVNGLKLGSCDCPAGNRGQMCYHQAAAAAVNMGVQGMRQGASAPVAPEPRIVRSVERDQCGARVKVTRCDGWTI
jgi:uncharacterized Zn finger protein